MKAGSDQPGTPIADTCARTEVEPLAPTIPAYGAWSLAAGETYEISFPFKRGEYEPYPDYEEPASGATFCRPKPQSTWIPGWDSGADYYDEWTACEGWGAEIRTVVSVHRPGHYPERVFYIRQWRDPDGRLFGKKRLRILASRDFRSWARGTRYHRAFTRMRCKPALATAPAEASPLQAVPPIRDEQS